MTPITTSHSFLWKKIATALGLAYLFALAWTVYADIVYDNKVPLEAYEFHGLYPLSLSLSALIAVLVYDRNIRAMGFHRMSIRYIFIPLFLLVLLVGIPFLLNWFTGMVNIKSLNQLNPELVEALPAVIILAILEEVMWRGVIYEALSELYTLTKVSLFTALFWSLWHFPVIIHTKFVYAEWPLVYSLPAFCFMILCSSFIYTYLRNKSGSIWSCVCLHGMWNYLVFAFVIPLEESVSPMSLYFKADIGITYLIIYAFVAWFFIKKINHK